MISLVAARWRSVSLMYRSLVTSRAEVTSSSTRICAHTRSVHCHVCMCMCVSHKRAQPQGSCLCAWYKAGEQPELDIVASSAPAGRVLRCVRTTRAPALTLGCSSSARAMASRCFCPPLSAWPRSPTSVSYPCGSCRGQVPADTTCVLARVLHRAAFAQNTKCTHQAGPDLWVPSLTDGWPSHLLHKLVCMSCPRCRQNFLAAGIRLAVTAL